MKKLNIKYRTWHTGIPPKPIKLEIPGWAGEYNSHSNGDRPQPWHCVPWIEGSTYGLELCYSFATECHVKLVNDKIVFEGDFSEENKLCPGVNLPPFMSFAPGHFGMTASLDIRVPEGYILRLEPHPRFYTDMTDTVPCCVAGHIQTDWWPRIFFVVFKNPRPGQTLVFKKGEAFGQALVLPRKISYCIEEMSEEEKLERLKMDKKIDDQSKKYVKNDWRDNQGHNFTDKYKQLSIIANKGGTEAVNKFLEQLSKTKLQKNTCKRKLLKRTTT